MGDSDIIMQVNKRRGDYNGKQAMKRGIVLSEFLARTVGHYDISFYSIIMQLLEGSLVRQPTLDLRWTDQTGSRIFVTQKWEPLVNTSNGEN